MEIKIVALNIHHASYQQTQCILLKGESPVQFATDICASIGSVNKIFDQVVARGVHAYGLVRKWMDKSNVKQNIKEDGKH